jgi:hypothetical protein
MTNKGKEDWPGPGAHTLNTSFGSAPRYSLGKSKRTDFTKQGGDKPEPCKYEVR